MIVEYMIGTLKLRFSYRHNKVKLTLKNVPKVLTCYIGLQNFIINTGGEYFDDCVEPENERFEFIQ